MTQRTAIVRAGGLLLSEPLEIPDGTQVKIYIESVKQPSDQAQTEHKGDTDEDPLRDLESWAADGPEDLSRNHDFYASGAPKRAR